MLPLAATFKLPSLVGQASPLVIMMSGEDVRPTIGAGGVLRKTYTPLYRSTDPSIDSGCSVVNSELVEPSRRSPPFLEGNQKRLKFLYN